MKKKQFEKLGKLNNIDNEMLKQVIEVLKLFHEATDLFSKSLVITSPDIWPTCLVNNLDFQPITELKQTLMRCLGEKYQIVYTDKSRL